jgi:flagellar protein FlgJ
VASRLTPAQFVQQYARYALQNEARTGIPALVTLAQAAGESGWSGSRPGNMMFGIKADAAWRGQKQLLWTQEVYNGVRQSVQAWFRAYPSLADSFYDHSRFLLENSRYHSALQHKREPYRFMQEVARAGYATAPNYYEFMAGIMRTLEPHLAEYRRTHPLVGREKDLAKGAAALVVGFALLALLTD